MQTATVEVWSPEELAACKQRDPIAWIIVQKEIKRGEAVIRNREHQK